MKQYLHPKKTNYPIHNDGVQPSKICTTPLVEYGKKSIDGLRANRVSYELEQVALDIIISTGLVSKCSKCTKILL